MAYSLTTQPVDQETVHVTENHMINHSGDRGRLLGIIRPAWRKVLESETKEDGEEKIGGARYRSIFQSSK